MGYPIADKLACQLFGPCAKHIRYPANSKPFLKNRGIIFSRRPAAKLPQNFLPFQNLLYQVPAIGITDIVDILVVSIIFYSLLRLIRSTSAARVARAILLLLAITLLTDVLNLYTLNWLLNKILEVGAIALIIVFQPELRRALERVGAQLHFHLLSTEAGASIEQSAVDRHGAGLRDHVA